MELASKDPISLSPKQKWLLGCLSTLPWCARAWKLEEWVEGLKLDLQKVRKNAFLSCRTRPLAAARGLVRSCEGLMTQKCTIRPCPSQLRGVWAQLRGHSAPSLHLSPFRQILTAQTSFSKTAIVTSFTVGSS